MQKFYVACLWHYEIVYHHESHFSLSYENKMNFFFLSANLLALVVSASSVKTSKGQTPNVEFVFTNFLDHKGYYLNVTTVSTELVQDSFECAFKCLEKDPCLSFNLADLDDNIDNLLCELLPSDRYTRSDKFNANHLWYHYSIASPCSRLPCQNDGTCVPLYRTNSYKCRCTKAYQGSYCENVDNDCSCSSGPEGKQRCKIGHTPNGGVVFTDFLAHNGYYLNITTVGTELVQDSFECAFKCLEKDPCLSFNLADLHDNIDSLLCELLPSDHYTHSDKYITNRLWYHYSIASPCLKLPCQNDGTCIPLYRTNSYKCRCTKACTGSHCEKVDDNCSCSSGPEGKQRCKIEYLMVFPEPRSTGNYAMKNPAIASGLSQLSLCFFITLVQDQGTQTVVSYAKKRNNEMLVEIYPKKTFVYVGNKLFRFNSTNLYDDTWQHVCLTWENTQGVAKLYRDGQFTEQITNHITKNYALKAGGFLVLGQDQDSLGGDFNVKQTLHGRLASVNMWDKVLSESEIAAQYTNCSVPHGSVLNWSVFKNLTHGNVTVEEP